MRQHDCPSCVCVAEPKCTICNDTGTITESSFTAPYDRGDGVMYGSGGWAQKPCPNGCPQQMRAWH